VSQATELSIQEDLEVILYSVSDHIATITLNRPERLNAFIPEMRVAYLASLKKANLDPDVRVIVVTGAGRAFTSGADFRSLHNTNPTTFAASYADDAVPLDYAMELEKPLIAAINGAVAGVGIAHALMADIRFASEDAFFTTSFSRLGLTAELGIAWLLERLVGTANALDLLYTSRRVSSSEAKAMGLVQRVVPAARLLDEVYAFARQIVDETSAYSLGVLRGQVYRSWAQDWRAAYQESEKFVLEQFGRSEFAERARARTARA
jgi:enoyl-CoA hydratase/carnithine racemase